VRVVLDTNILVSALITKGTPPDILYQAWLREEIELVTSVTQLHEISDVLSRKRLRKWIEPKEARQLIATIARKATILRETPVTKRSPDPKDDPILAIAVSGDAAMLVSGDKSDMLALDNVEGIPIRSARQAVQVILEARTKDGSPPKNEVLGLSSR